MSDFFSIPKVNSFGKLPADFYTRLNATPVSEPLLLHVNRDAVALLGLDPAYIQDPHFLRVLSGQEPLPGGDTLAAVYSGHQFGVWAGQLGDGRAHLLGELDCPSGRWELQLKGAGKTPYSRMGDGRAVLRSSVREYLASQAMHGLGIPTTRALALVTGNDPVIRETVETSAIVTRMSPTFVRFGSFEHWAAHRRVDLIKLLADYVIDRFYPECRLDDSGGWVSEDPYVRFLQSVVSRTAELMASWQVVGFCHGVMNTDNMSILGLTLDYGPYGFMDGFDAGHICNHTDSQGRYAWHAQPSVAHWNLYQLANSLHVMVDDASALRAALDQFEPVFLQSMQQKMMSKLGLQTWMETDASLVDDLWKLMHQHRADFTLTFRQLAYASGVPLSSAMTEERIQLDLGGSWRPGLEPFVDLFPDRQAAREWLQRYLARLSHEHPDPDVRVKGMMSVNPLYVLRNHLAQQAIEAAQAGDPSEIDTLMKLLSNPFTPQPGFDTYAALPPAWASRIEVSCSS